MADLLVELAGGVRVRTSGAREVRIASRKALALLACLALRPGAVHSRDFLASLLWEDSDPELARSSLRQALAALRRALGADCAAALRADAVSVSLDADLATSDVAQFHALLRDGSPGALVAAAARCAGELFEGLDARSSAFDRWMEEHRRAFRRQVLEAMERAATQCDAAGDLAGRIAALERLTSIEPANERAHRGLMEALARQGRYTDALRQYRLCRDALRRDLDVATEPATEALYRDILRRRRAEAPDDGTADGEYAPAAAAAPLPAAATLREAVVMVVRIGGTVHPGGEDPELTRQRWSTAEARVRGAAEPLGGCVDRPSQGEIVAAFGLASLTGNEAERAARAALHLTAESSNSGSDCPLAIGIAEGQVLPAGGDAPFPLNGSPVGKARELSRAASYGCVTVSDEVANRLSHRYRLEPCRGQAPGEAWQITTAQGGAGPGPTRRFAGRRAELAMLTAMFERVRASGRGRAVVVRGEAGIGKSSMLDALASSAADRGAVVHIVQVLDFGQSSVERPVPALASRLLGLGPDSSAAERAVAVDAAVASGRLPVELRLPACDLLGAASTPEALSMLAAMDSATRERERAHVLHWLVLHGQADPVLIVVEDVHWAEPVEMAQLGDLAAAAAVRPVLLALSTRPEGDPVNAAWRARSRGCPVTALDLAPLDDDEARELASNYADLPVEVIERCLETASGHPLFLEQLLRAARAGQSSLPGSVRGLVLARIERLPAVLQNAVHAAAVLGVRFTMGALRHLLADPGFDVAPLEGAGLLARAGEECRFAHALIRDAVYESLLGSARRELHRRAAGWFESRDSGLYADHLAAAADALAATAYLRAAGEAMLAYRLDRALVYAERARETARHAGELFDACATLGDVHLAIGRSDEAVAAFRECIDLATDSAARARAWLGLATGLRIVDRHDEALAALEHAEQAMGTSDLRGLAHLWTLRGNLHFPRGELDACLHAHRRALEIAERAGSPEDVARALGGLGDAHYQRGRIRTAHYEFSQCIELAERQGLVGLRIKYLPMLSTTHAYVGEFAQGVEASARAAASAREVGDRRAELLANSVKAAIDINCARFEAAEACSDRALALAREMGARRFEAEALIVQGLAKLGLGDRESALAVLEQAVELARAVASTYCGPWALAALALASGNPPRGRALLAEGEEWLARGCVGHNHLEFHCYAIEFCLRHGDPDGARRHAALLAAYTQEEPLPWADVVIARGRALARVLDGERGNDLRQALDAALCSVQRMQFAAQLPALQAAIELHSS